MSTGDYITNNTTIITTKYASGYDLPITGLDNGQFLAIHIPALICLFFGLISSIAVIIVSFTNNEQRAHTFFKWTKSERFAVYIAICDAFYSICHSLDHLHITLTRNHVYPKLLCRFYGFMIVEFEIAQNLMVNVVAINAFVLIIYRKKINFGVYDWKLLLWMFGAPFFAALIALSFGTMGPNGAYCAFDGVKGKTANLFFTTILLTTILIMNSTLYALTWYRTHKEEPRFKTLAGQDANVIRASHRAAKNMSLFVAAFFIQWLPLAIYGLWLSSNRKIPIQLFQFVITFSNIGGVLNAIVYFVIRRRKRSNALQMSTDELPGSRSFRYKSKGYSFRSGVKLSPQLTRHSKVTEEGVPIDMITSPSKSFKHEDVEEKTVVIPISKVTLVVDNIDGSQ